MLGVVATGTFAQGADAAIDIFFEDCLGWFATPIFMAVPIAGTRFRPIAGWLMVAALIFTLDFGLLQFRRIDLAIASVIEKPVPFLALLCVAMSLIVVGMNIGALGAAFNV